jgi:CMP-N,N'-diacetyllegionaminic acid synthase
MQLLFVIPARGGSKGIPGKNIKPLNGKPLIHYSIEYARQFTTDEFICVTTDSDAIAASAAEIGLTVPFKRPAELATDTAGSYEVLQHALAFYEEKGKSIDAVVLLQPTSPLREKYHLETALGLFDDSIDMVVSVQLSAANPYYNLFEENNKGYLHNCKGDGAFTRRQDTPAVYAYNGSIYIINPASLKSKTSFKSFDKVKKYVMEDKYSVDLDTMQDWEYTEYLLQRSKQ